MGFVLVSVLLCVGSLNLSDVVLAQQKIWFCIPLFPMFIIFFVSILAETNRHPFDLPEAESELVAGFMTALVAWAVVPFDDGWVIADINVGILYLFAISSIGVYGIIIAGWASNSKYAFLGALRSAAQMVSYEVSIGFVLITVLLCVGSLNLTQVVLAQSGWFFNWFWLPLLPMFVIFFVSALAETNRTPFDLPMSEAELVQGFQTEYSSMPFALFFLGEYANMILLSGMGAILFLGGWMSPIPFAPFTWVPGLVWFALKIAFLLFVFSWTKGTLPRYRYDQLMRLGWKVFLPVSLGWVVLTAAVLQFGGWAPKP